ncbi:hypothetical protein GB928_027610 [Shinella curvata]|uniref:Uncharacterized protein n=1 Tax=Shinella curvata TaxID=1817964 RepID=A0ABT8XP60_9HYPH|nr:hypothetical protein [Shinella curvata]MCJ8053926.1 hypothetical protein [Shinella curvata]MDO6124955.1 hypothetical protein [Shinella curvata]
MEHIAAFMLLIGCNAGSLSCEELPAPQVAFESMEECVGALPVALGGAGAKGRIVHARCAAIDPAWVEEDVEISWRMSREKGLEIEIRETAPPADGMLVAENAHPAEVAARLH